MIHRHSVKIRKLAPFTFLILFSLTFLGCASFLAGHAVKTYPLELEPSASSAAQNQNQRDFLYLTELTSEVFPLRDRYFPAERRTNMETRLLDRLGQTNCTHETFVLAVRSYLAAHSNEHARILYNPKPLQLTGLYPFKAQYVSNDLCIADLTEDYPSSAIGRKIVAINSHPIAEVERRFATFFSEENAWTKRAALESPPHPYSRPDFYRITSLSHSMTNDLLLDLEGHPSLALKPLYSGDSKKLKWQRKYVPNPITARSRHLFDYRTFPAQNLAYLQFNACFDQSSVTSGVSFLKPWVRPFALAWIYTQIIFEQPSPLLRGAYDPTQPSLKNFLAKAIADINQQGITNLVLDLRHNGGGEVKLCYQLLYHLTSRTNITDASEFRFNPAVFAYYHPHTHKQFRKSYRAQFNAEPPSDQLFPASDEDRATLSQITNPESRFFVPPDRPTFNGRIVVLANQNTRSAASLLAALMQDNHLAQIVGAPTGNNPTGPTALTMFKLPHSGILISLPTDFNERANPAQGPILLPDHWAQPHINDLTTGNDTAFNKAVELLLAK